MKNFNNFVSGVPFVFMSVLLLTNGDVYSRDSHFRTSPQTNDKLLKEKDADKPEQKSNLGKQARQVPAADFMYGPGGTDTDWPADFCQDGVLQSPIDLPLDAKFAKYGGLQFNDYKSAFDGTIANTGYSLEIVLSHGGTISITKGGLAGTYILHSIHFHWGAEHTIDGISYAAEAHLVHRNIKYDTYEDSWNKPDGIAKLAVLFHVAEKDNPVINYILNSGRLPLLAQNTKVPLQRPFTPSDLLPDHFCAFFRYRGSRTVPNCEEVVTWTVFMDTLPISESQIAKFQTLASDRQGGTVLTANNRPIKPRNDRLVTFQPAPGCHIKGGSVVPWFMRPYFWIQRH